MPIYGFSVGPSVPDFENSLGKAANYVFGATQWTADLEYEDPLFGTAKEYSDNFQKSFDYAPDYHVAESTAGCYALQLAIERRRRLLRSIRHRPGTSDRKRRYAGEPRVPR
jgi:hypothetical protein